MMMNDLMMTLQGLQELSAVNATCCISSPPPTILPPPSVSRAQRTRSCATSRMVLVSASAHR